MSNVIYGQYDSQAYPLKRFYYDELPESIHSVVIELSQKRLAACRGGLAFVFLLDEYQYLLKDLDMLALEHQKLCIFDALSEADIVYLNKNTFWENVISAFWQCGSCYYKLDILLCSNLPKLCEKKVNGINMAVVSASYIWKNRLEKIAEKEIRKHDDTKTLNHYKVANELSKYLLNHPSEIIVADRETVHAKLVDVKRVLSSILNENEAEEFIQMQIALMGIKR